MGATYKNNRLTPKIIIVACVVSIFWLLNPAIDGYGLTGIVLPLRENGQPRTTFSTTASSDAVPSHTPPATEIDSLDSQQHHSYEPILLPNDVLLIMKTGGTTLWKRLLIHLTTSLAPERIRPANTVVYSDSAETIGNFSVVDIFANTSQALRSEPDFDVYREQMEHAAHNYYVEAAGVGGDDWGPAGGWIIDKYKFVPLIAHAGHNWPRAKWYIYMEDDTYLFLPNVLRYLATFDWRRPQYLGSYAAKSDVIFAHGGAGFALSRGAWEASFGRNPNLAEELLSYTRRHCCGDQVLAHALEKYGVHFGENDGDGKFRWGFNPVVHWTFSFSRHNWCSPLMSWHKVHSRDVARYYELEKNWDFAQAPLLHRDLFSQLILPDIKQRREWWDNMASLYEVTSANKDAPPAPEGVYDELLWKHAWESADACEVACRSWENCMQWSFVEDLCKMDDKMVMGQGYAPAMSQRKTALMHTSGWLPDRLDRWAC